MKNLTVSLLPSFLVLAAMNSCMSGESKQKSLNGFDVVFLDDKKGDPAKEGDWVYLRYYVMSKDSLIFSSMMQSPVLKFKLPKLEKVADIKSAKPLVDVLHMMSKGDSAIVSQETDDQMRRSMNLPKVNVLDFHVKLFDIKSEAEYQKEVSK